jgi:C4-dicarboxylate-specific signal transduction histidine kinase
VPGDDPEDRRSRSMGRREEDWIIPAILKRIERLEDRLERAVDRLDRTREEVGERVDELEQFHIEDRTEARLRIDQRTQQLHRWQLVSIGVGVIAALIGAATGIIALLH